MSRINDLGGIHGFGPITPQAGEPVFNAEWEGRILAIQRALGYTRSWHIDQFRDAQERLPPPLYLSLSNTSDGFSGWNATASRPDW